MASRVFMHVFVIPVWTLWKFNLNESSNCIVNGHKHRSWVMIPPRQHLITPFVLSKPKLSPTLHSLDSLKRARILSLQTFFPQKLKRFYQMRFVITRNKRFLRVSNFVWAESSCQNLCGDFPFLDYFRWIRFINPE
jgi:hypothetical protein